MFNLTALRKISHEPIIPISEWYTILCQKVKTLIVIIESILIIIDHPKSE
ncbi:hypothetical protein KQ874_00700 [Mycoplasma sp. ES3157-GEN-MYC]|uniref:Uncharacterized protein n=1 Tax=Mycoplasma miroungigenitalium TaxID=754515 RepID=A0A6M4JB61_9MOLU|nr:hypothetical protein [Mycoplasma miroungigenitalium]MBU4690225.1 hypothetical protein [Mycoplasma miroungigenitalium]QJR43327.1 hypothetical protein HLA87_00690 [Mycoplasma miroungigenitalium]